MMSVDEFAAFQVQTQKVKAAINTSAILCMEGLLHYALSIKVKKTAQTIIRAQLQILAGAANDSLEPLVQPALLAAAKGLLG
jgi:hypothetical protein